MTVKQEDAGITEENKAGKKSDVSSKTSGDQKTRVQADDRAEDLSDGSSSVEKADADSDDAETEGDSAQDEASPEESDESLAEALVDAREKFQILNDKFLRVQAEMQNVNKRSQNEIQKARKYAIEGFAQELLPVKDSLDQAAQVDLGDAAGEAVTRMMEGLELTLKQLESVLSKFSIEEVEAAPGVKFNPEIHQAVSMIGSDEFESNHIVSVMQKGFLLNDRLLRPAMVVVAS